MRKKIKKGRYHLLVLPFSAMGRASQRSPLGFVNRIFFRFYIESIEINHFTILTESIFAESVIATGLADCMVIVSLACAAANFSASSR